MNLAVQTQVALSDPHELTRQISSGGFLGVTDLLSNLAYHQAPGLSFTGLKHFGETPAHYKFYKDEQAKENETLIPDDSQRVGSLYHLLTLEPDQASRIEVIDGTWSHATKAKVLEALQAGRLVCKSGELERAKRMSEATLSHSQAANLLRGGLPERSIFWQDPETHVLLKCRPDYMNTERGYLVDLKSFRDLARRPISKQIFRMRYYWQAKLYLMGASEAYQKTFALFAHVFQQDSAPFLTRVTVINQATLEKGQEEIRQLLPRYAECLRTNQWPGYPDEIIDISLPDYAWSDWETEA